MASDTHKEEKKELFATLDKLKNEVNTFRKELNKINDEKEAWFNKKDDLSDKIRDKIKVIKENKVKRDNLTKKVKELKEKRNSLNQEARNDIFEHKKLKTEVDNLSKKLKIKNPHKIKGDIDQIEVKLETEVMSFEKEKELSKKLKQLKKSYEDASEIIGIIDKLKKLEKEIDSSKKEGLQKHNEIQKIAKDSQELHEDIIKSSKEIDELKTQEEEAFKKFLDFKKNFNDINTKLKEKLSEMSSLRDKIYKFKLEEDEKRKLKESIIIKSKESEIEEKIKGRKKLTTEDFLAFQEAIKNKENI